MSIPADELQHYDRAAEEAAQAEADAINPPPLTDEQKQHVRMLAAQAHRVIEKCPDLLEWLWRRPVPRTYGATASEHALWRTGYEDCLRQIETTALWRVDTDG